MNYLKWIGKIGVTVLLLYLVGLKIDPEKLWISVRKADPIFLFAAFVSYTASRFLGACRLQRMLVSSGIRISALSNLRLYWISMFYGMFLPGGLGGDAYKVFYLKKSFSNFSVISLTKILLWDRILGFVVLILLALVPATVLLPGNGWELSLIPAFVIVFYSLRWCVNHWIPGIRSDYAQLLLLSVFIQLSQIIAMIALMVSIGLYEKFIEYSLLFLLSSIVSILPITVGGIGIRELAFLYGSKLLAIPHEPAVISSFLFDVIVTALALTGSVFTFQNRPGPTDTE